MDLIEFNFENTNRHPWELSRQSIIHKLIKKHSTLKNRYVKVLDVGSGDAFLANGFTHLSEVKHSYCVDTEYTDKLKKQILNYYTNDKLSLYTNLDDIELDNIELVTLLDVIEHVPNDRHLIKTITDKKYINQNSIFIITVPAYQSLFSQHDKLLKHYRRYNLKQLQTTIIKSDLEVLDSGYFFFSLLIPRILRVLIEKFKKKDLDDLENLGNWNKGETTTLILKNILLLDYKIGRLFKKININIPGLSCYVVCRKVK